MEDFRFQPLNRIFKLIYVICYFWNFYVIFHYFRFRAFISLSLGVFNAFKVKFGSCYG